MRERERGKQAQREEREGGTDREGERQRKRGEEREREREAKSKNCCEFMRYCEDELVYSHCRRTLRSIPTFLPACEMHLVPRSPLSRLWIENGIGTFDEVLLVHHIPLPDF